MSRSVTKACIPGPSEPGQGAGRAREPTARRSASYPRREPSSKTSAFSAASTAFTRFETRSKRIRP